MPNSPSAKKRLRQTRRRTAVNRSRLSRVRTFVRRVEEASFDLVRDFVLQRGRLDRGWLEDLLELREVLIPAILRVALERSSQAQRDQAVKLLQEAVSPGLSDAALVDALREIQLEFARMTGNRVMIMLAHTVGRLMAQLVNPSWRRSVLSDRERYAPSLRRLAIAVEAGDVETAERAPRDFLRRVGESILRAVDEVAPGR